jgi:hypothetical protein
MANNLSDRARSVNKYTHDRALIPPAHASESPTGFTEADGIHDQIRQRKYQADAETLNPATIVRINRHENPYVMIDRTTLQDARLSLEARGLLGYLLTLPVDWVVRVSHLQRQGGAGRDAIRRIIRELQQFGYISGFGELERQERGRFAPTEIRVYEVPTLNPFYSEAKSPAPENPAPVNPAPGNPTPYKGDKPQKKEVTKNTHTQSHLRAAGAPDVVVGQGSKFSQEECLRYANHLHTTGQGITNPGGFATTIYKSGVQDPQIASWLAGGDPERVQSGEPPAPQIELTTNPPDCPDCNGSGWSARDPQKKLYARCPHPRLKKEVTEGKQVA